MTASHPLSSIRLALIGASLVFVPAAMAADPLTDPGAYFSVKAKAGGLSEDARDLSGSTAGETRASYLDLQPQLHLQASENFASFLRLQAFVPSDMVVQNENDEPVEAESYAAVREFWVEFGGITSYPGEVLRLGLQRVRAPDGLWWDRDIESARWIFDTTLFQFEMGAAKQYNTYRTDEVELPESQRDRAYGFASIATQWVPGNYIGVRGAYATDQKELPRNGSQMAAEGTQTDPNTGGTTTTWDQPEQRDYGWLGVFLDNRFFESERGAGLAYRMEIMGLAGTRDYAVVDPASGVVTGSAAQDVSAVGADASVRARFPDAFPLTFGAGYAYGQGGSERGESNVFRQTGLQSNRSRFTGTRTYINRFNEALQADLSNLHAKTAFVSLPLPSFDLSLVGHRFERDDPSSPVYTDGIEARPDPASTSKDLGTGADVVLTWYFRQTLNQRFAAEDDTRSNIRLRASRFSPGEAYADGLEDQNRVLLEGTLWF